MHLIQAFDQRVTQQIQAIGGPRFGKLMWMATFAGNGVILVIITGLCAVAAVHNGDTAMSSAFVISGFLMLLYNASKFMFKRRRPDNLYANRFRTTSFPSGHAADSVAIYGLIGYVIATHFGAPFYLLGITIGVVAPFITGISRIYLGAHYPTDVLGGWIIAALGLGLVITAYHI